MKQIKFIISLCLTLVLFTSCEEDNYEFGPIITPSNVQVTAEIVGQDDENPNGDGDGYVNFVATAQDGVTYQFNFGDGNSEVAPSGMISHRYSQTGVNDYTVIINAVGTGGVLSSTSIDITVFSSFEDLEALEFLSGLNEGDTKTWVWASDIPLHIGLGPVTDDYGGGEFAWPNWWNSIQPNDPEKSCMYSNEFVFTTTADGLTFEQTVGPAFIPGTYADIIGVAGDTCHDESVATTMFGVKNVSFSPSSSKAALEGSYDEVPYRMTSFQISDGGFMGWYTGNAVYDIISISATELHVRSIQEGGGFAWYAKYKVSN